MDNKIIMSPQTDTQKLKSSAETHLESKLLNYEGKTTNFEYR